VRRKQKLSGHQKLLRNFTIFFAALAVALMIALMWFMNSSYMKGH